MNKQDFLRELEINLSSKIKEDDLQNILMDYDEIFESNKAENKTEDETFDEIGSPAIVARNILDECSYLNSVKHTSAHNLKIAPIGKRIVAYIIDTLITSLPIAITANTIILFFAPFNPIISFIIPVRSNPPLALSLFLSINFMLYGTLSMLLLKSKTIGMFIMGIKVVKTNHSKVKVMDVILRQFIGKIVVPTVTFGLSTLVSFFWMLFSDTNNTVHDKIAGTLVVDDCKGKKVK